MKPNWFVGIPVPAQNWLTQLLAEVPESCRPFHPEDLHMTLAFLGPIRAEDASLLYPIIDRIEARPFHLTLGKMIGLPRPQKVTALAMEPDQGRELAVDLIADWRTPLLEAVGARLDHRPPLPHITVARPIRKYGHGGREAALAWSQGISPPEVTLLVDRVALYTWAENRSERQFQKVYEHAWSLV